MALRLQRREEENGALRARIYHLEVGTEDDSYISLYVKLCEICGLGRATPLGGDVMN